MGFFSSIGDAIGGIVGGAANVVGGILGNNSQSSANSANLDFARQQFEYQKELHKNQLQWRVEDAKKAGLHPMAALGLQSSSFSPVSSNVQANDYSWIGDLGQSAGYAAMKGKDKEQQRDALLLAQKQANLQSENMQLQNDGLRLENEFRRFQLQQAVVGGASQALRSAGSVSTRGLSRRSYAIDGQADSYMGEPIEKYAWQITPSGRHEFGPSSDYASLYEDKLGIEWLPFLEASVLPKVKAATGQNLAGRKWSFSDWDWIPAKDKTSYEKLVDRVRGKPLKSDSELVRFLRWFESRFPSSGY